MQPLRRPDPDPPPTALHEHAAEQLAFIRDAMERAGTFTAVPGWGAVAMGGSALVASAAAALQPSRAQWLAIWVLELGVAVGIGVTAMLRKLRAERSLQARKPLRRFLLAFLPPIWVGALLTVPLYRSDRAELLPAAWLLSYGAAVVSGGAFSVRPVPAMGLAFMALGTVALAAAPAAGDLLLAIGFGGIHIVGGWFVARRYGG